MRIVARAGRLAVAALVMLAVLAPGPIAAGAQTGALEVVSQSISVPADGVFSVDLRWTGEWSGDLTVSATVFAPLTAEDQVDEPPGEAINRFPPSDAPLSLDAVDRLSEAEFRLDIPIRSFSAPDDRLWLSEAGVYPVTVEIRSSDGAIASTRTHLIHLPGETAEIQGLGVGFVLDVSPADGVEIDEAVQLLADHPTLPLLVVLESGVLTQLAGDPTRASAFAAALGERRVTGEPTLGLDPSALAAIGQGDLYADELEQFWNRFTLVGLRPDRSTLALQDTLTEEGATLLASLDVELVIDLTAADSAGTIQTAASGLVVVAVDQASTSALRRSQNAVLQAHELLARLTIRRATQPAPALLGGPEVRLVSLQGLDLLFTALEQQGAIVPLPFDLAVAQNPILPAGLPTTADQSLADATGRVTEIRDLLGVYEQFHAGGSPTPTELERALLRALTIDRNALDRAVDLERVVDELDAAFSVISLPERQSINLAARNRAIPLSITNDGAGERNVLLRFTSDRIEVEQDETVVAIPAGTSSIEIDVVARSLGVSPLDVEILTPDGRRVLATTRFQIRSTAVPGLGYLLSGAALVFLVAWWIVSITRTRALEADTPDTSSTEAQTADDNAPSHDETRRATSVHDAVEHEISGDSPTSVVGDR